MSKSKANLPDSQIIIYQSDDGQTRIEVRLENETVWLTQSAIADLFQTTPQNITQHIRAIYAENELSELATCKENLQVQIEGSRKVSRMRNFYNLDMILAIGYRVRSHRGVQFRQWATQQLKEYIVKGFLLDDERLKERSSYFGQLLERIRDIRSSEKIFYRKVLDIYATSIDYDPNSEISKELFKTVQNKMHWAAHGHTAAEIISQRSDAQLPFMGLTSWGKGEIRKNDTFIAKNYLNEKELEALNRIVMAYLEFAELQALNREPMYMSDWIKKLDDFLKLSGRELLQHAGTVSHENALEKAMREYEKYKEVKALELTKVEKDFIEYAVKTEKKIKKIKGNG